MSRHSSTLVEIIKNHGNHQSIPYIARRHFNKIIACSNKELGSHVIRCNDCLSEHLRPNSCKSRHCPSCSYARRQRWIQDRQKEALKTQYFHLVFTIPHELNSIVRYNFKPCVNILFSSVSKTLKKFSKNPGKNLRGGTPGIMLVLHTWDQQLKNHFHIHALMTGGWLTDCKNWESPKDLKFLFPVRQLQAVFRGFFVSELISSLETNKIHSPPGVDIHECIYSLPKTWVVYSEPISGSPNKIIQYLGAYTNRTGLSEKKISYNKFTSSVNLQVKCRQTSKLSSITMSSIEFLLRFSSHIFSQKVQRIRYYGLFSNASKKINLILLSELLENQDRVMVDQDSQDNLSSFKRVLACPRCKSTNIKVIFVYWSKIEHVFTKPKSRAPPLTVQDPFVNAITKESCH